MKKAKEQEDLFSAKKSENVSELVKLLASISEVAVHFFFRTIQQVLLCPLRRSTKTGVRIINLL